MRQASRLAALLVGMFLTVPAIATAQSSIIGIVKDTSGAVLPGVTIEASSDVLIEKSKSAVTDGNGQYRIVDLRPGTYVVVFTLTGFQTLKRENIELPAEFTANVNIEMKIGAIEETIVVSAASPIVDVSSAAHIQVLDRDSLDNLPTGRTIQGLGQIIVGVTLSSPDVGGSRAAMQTYMSVHGQSSANNSVMVDGLAVNGLEANGSVQSYFNDAASQEMSYQTSAIGAETSGGGIRLNLIPREGGNRFAGDSAITYRPGAWQGDNLTQRLKDRGLAVGNSTEFIADFTASQGGPIRKDRLWFFGTYRDYDTSNRIANTFFDDGSQGDDFNYIRQGSGRITYQVSPKNKLSGFYDRISKYRAHDMTSLVDPETASVVWTSPDYHTGGVKYTSTISTRLLAEAGYSENIEYRTTTAQEGIAKQRNTPEWFAGASRTPNIGSGRIGAPSPSGPGKDWPARHNVQGSLSYITGSHHAKLGAQWQWGTFLHTNDGNADLIQRYRTVVRDATGAISALKEPVDVRPYNTPVESQERLNADVGVFAQDAWTLKRLTLNAGIRWEYLDAQVDSKTAPAGRFVPARTEPTITHVPKWTDWAPRIQVAYDLFGNAKTAIKYSINRYNAAQSVGVAQTFNALGVTGATSLPTLSWTDLNGDDIAQGGRDWSTGSPVDCVYLTPGCEINLGQLPKNYGLLDAPGVYQGYPRGYNIEQGFEVQHELLPRVSVTGTYYRGYNKNLTTTINRAITPADYTKVTIFNPVDGTPIDYYNISSDAQGRATDNYTFLDPDRFNHYQSYSTEFRARPGGGAVIFGGVSWERELANAAALTPTTSNCTVGRLQNPNLLRFCDRENLPSGRGIPFAVNGRLNASYLLPWQAVTVSASFQSNDGGSRTFSYQFDKTTKYPDGVTLKGPDGVAFSACPSPCTPGALVFTGLTPANATVSLFPSGSKGNRNERLNQLDLKVSKTFTVRRLKISPAFEAFNVNNSDKIISYSSANYATASYNAPSSILQGRILGVATSVRW